MFTILIYPRNLFIYVVKCLQNVEKPKCSLPKQERIRSLLIPCHILLKSRTEFQLTRICSCGFEVASFSYCGRDVLSLNRLLEHVNEVNMRQIIHFPRADDGMVAFVDLALESMIYCRWINYWFKNRMESVVHMWTFGQGNNFNCVM